MNKENRFGNWMILPRQDDSILSLHLNDVAKHELLSKEDEILLFRELDRVWATRQADVESDQKPPEAAYPIINKLILHNCRLVISIARKYRSDSLTFNDLIDEGYIGLRKAITRFDASRGVRLSTYISYWIWQAIGRAAKNQNGVIRIPVHQQAIEEKVNKQTEQFLMENGRLPEMEELINLTGQSEAVLKRINSPPVLSLDDELFSDNDGANLHHRLADDSDVVHDTELSALGDTLDEVLSELSPRTERIIRMRFGMPPNGRVYTLDETGKKFGITRERVRQIESAALRKLRHPKRTRKLREYL